MKQVSLVQLGFGTVGGTLIEQILACRTAWQTTFGIDVRYAAVAGTTSALLADTPDGLDETTLREVVASRRSGLATRGDRGLDRDDLARITARGATIVLDAAAGEASADLDAKALDLGAGVVLSNKAPLALPRDDPRSRTLWAQSGPLGRLRYEATCGAGLPVISTLRSLLDSGDEVIEISGTVSGTFGAIFSAVAAGTPFSVAVRDAREQGYTEPDPRDDLSGLDVARKGLILARTLGREIDLDAIEIRSLVPEHLSSGSIDAFLEGLADEDQSIRVQSDDARDAGSALKYLLRLTGDGDVSVGLGQIPLATVLGALQGPENIVSFRTRRYDTYPCVVSGPGAGAEVTAAGMVADMLALAQRL